MTATYSFDPSTSSKDAVRFLVQDTDVVTAGVVRLQDEEINWVLSQQSNVFLAAAECADAIAAYWAKIQNTRIGPLNIQRGQAVPFYISLAEQLRNTAARWAGAIAVFYPVNDPAYQNTNCGNGGPQHIFKIGQEDFPGHDIFWPPADLPPLYSYP
jgi:hypothetical protein